MEAHGELALARPFQRVLAAQVLPARGEEEPPLVDESEPRRVAVVAGVDPDVAIGVPNEIVGADVRRLILN